MKIVRNIIAAPFVLVGVLTLALGAYIVGGKRNANRILDGIIDA